MKRASRAAYSFNILSGVGIRASDGDANCVCGAIPLSTHHFRRAAGRNGCREVSAEHHATPISTIPTNTVCFCVSVSISHCSGCLFGPPQPQPSSTVTFDQPQCADHSPHRRPRLSSTLTSSTTSHSLLIASVSANQAAHYTTRTRRQGQISHSPVNRATALLAHSCSRPR